MRRGPPYEAWATMQQHCKAIKVLRSDRGGEYFSAAFDQHLAKAGTVQKLTMHDILQLSGVTKRLNRTLLERIRAFTHVSGLPKSLWGEALRHATWLKNQTATRALDGKTPFAALYGQLLDLSALRTWGTVIWVHNAASSKLDVRARKARWLGLDVDARAHCIFWPGLGNVTVESNVYFGSTVLLEGEQKLSIVSSEQTAAPSIPISAPPPDSPEVPGTADTPPPMHISQPEQRAEPPTLRRSMCIRMPSRIIRELEAGKGIGLTCKAPQPEPADPDMPALTLEEDAPNDDEVEDLVGGAWTVVHDVPVLLEDFLGLEYAFAAETADAEVLKPRMLAEAKCRPDWPLWEKAIEEESAMLKAAGTWRLEEAPLGANIIGSKWVFKAKKDTTGNVVRRSTSGKGVRNWCAR